MPKFQQQNIKNLFDEHEPIEHAQWSNEDIDENGRGFAFADSDLQQPIEQPPAFVSNDTDNQYPKIGLKPVLHTAKN